MAPSYELYDDEAWDRGEAVFEAMNEKIYNEDFYYEIARFVTKHQKSGSPMKFFPPRNGAFNFYYRIQYSDGHSAIIRFPLPGFFHMDEEKLCAETTIPVPFILHYGMADESPGGLGPFIIMEYIDNSGDIADVLNTPGRPLGEKPVLDPHIDEEKLEYVYRQMADIMLQLSKCDFSRIGSLGMRERSINDDDSDPELSFQRNQAIKSADDCRKKYIARQLFRKLAAEGRIAGDRSPFKLWWDDLRPANVLVDADHRIVGVIDWEFTYAAPVEFTYSPPWWLLLIMPEEWPEGLDDWVSKYEPQLETFIHAMETKEREFIEQGRLDEPQLAYAARKSWAFDGIFWRSLDERFFGKNSSGFMERLKLLPSGQVAAMEAFVERKMEEKRDCTLIDWYAQDAESKLPPGILSLGSTRASGTYTGPAPTTVGQFGERVEKFGMA
ncbi:Uncharacterized protein BP5553_01484 [Venustampulla echinocandica]|uniref:Aminoglycoside phosphotransferase domain-containing protein n=1 Tax=Venustampulla echinocandica TaxID=2656787 RepID=A0A370U167_9HELO|nr:Uncharacterized protein BP5553_01484 [Venustampulla echinocandica]RDL41505.1 Uncharacterized protein BP5553_01484 [Venustampulla echinocandica]